MKQIIVTALILLVTPHFLKAQSNPAERTHNFNIEKGIAIQGYDPVAYFTLNKAIKGDKKNAVAYNGTTYYFASTENKDIFKKSPAKYEPQYGGWCAYAMGHDGSKVEVDPETFKIISDKLYLFYNKYFNNTLKSWNKDEANLKSHADANWQKINH